MDNKNKIDESLKDSFEALKRDLVKLKWFAALGFSFLIVYTIILEYISRNM